MPDDIVNNYAGALFEIALHKQQLDAFMQQLDAVTELMQSHKELSKAFINPIIPLSAKKRVIARVFEHICGQEIINFLNILIKNGRQKWLNPIRDQYMHLYHEYMGILEVKAVSARPLSAELEAMLKEKLEKLYHRQIYLESTVDPSILGGLRLEIGGKILDGSIIGRLNAVKSAIYNLLPKIMQ